MTLVEDLEIRILQLESKVNDGKQISYETAREQARVISEGKVKEHHLGTKSKEVLAQEIKSHFQNKQESFSKDELQQWKNKLAKLEKQLSEA